VTEPINQHFGPTQDPIDDLLRQWMNGHMGEWQRWLLEGFFEERILPALMQMTLQMSSMAMFQVGVIGTFLDAKHQMETQRLFQYMNAQAFKDYYPSEGLCTIGTIARSIQVADYRLPRTSASLSQYSMDRQLRNANRASAGGEVVERDARWRQWRATYCDTRDNNRHFRNLCGSGVEQLRRNRDVDYPRVLGVPTTLDLDFGNSDATNDETDLMALAANLYAHRPLPDIPPTILRSASGRSHYMDVRSLAAKRSVAEQSIQAVSALKTPSPITQESRAFLLALMREVGIAEDEAQRLLDQDTSYLGQMDLIARKLVQRPEFYVDLMDKPANVARKSVALQSLSLMQKRELFKSALRSEAIISVLLELELIDAQNRVQNRISAMTR
jgi:hypothetical protein